MTDLSIIIINFNTFDLTCNCIASVIEQTKSISYEIILVDNASSECDPELFKNKFPNIILLRSPVNLGFAKGNNLGIGHANGDFILLLNSDTVFINAAAEIVLKFMQEQRQYGIAAAQLVYPDKKIQANCQRFPSAWREFVELFRLHKFMSKKQQGKLFYSSFFNHNVEADPDWVWGTFFMFRKAALKNIEQGKLNDDFFMYAEDMLWCMQFRKAGWKIKFLPQAKVVHLLGQSPADDTHRNELMMMNEIEFMKKYFSVLHVFMIVFLHCLKYISLSAGNKIFLSHAQQYWSVYRKEKIKI